MAAFIWFAARLALALFGVLLQSSYSPGAGVSLLSGLSTVGVLLLLTWLWRRETRGRAYALAHLLPGPRAFRWMLLGLGGLYAFHIVAVNPERIPTLLAWTGHHLGTLRRGRGAFREGLAA